MVGYWKVAGSGGRSEIVGGGSIGGIVGTSMLESYDARSYHEIYACVLEVIDEQMLLRIK